MSFRPTNHSLTANKENTSPEEAITQPSPVLKKSCKLSGKGTALIIYYAACVSLIM